MSDEPSPNRLHLNAKRASRSRRFYEKTMNLIKNSYFSEDLRIRHGAIIIKGGAIIGQGINSMKNHPMAFYPILIGESNREIGNVLTIHAEMQAIKSVKNKKNLKGSIMFVGRLSLDLKERMSCPCESCEFYIKKYGIQKVIYSVGNNEWMEVKI